MLILLNEPFDFFNIYIMGVAQMLAALFCFIRFTEKRANLFHYIVFGSISFCVIFFIPFSGWLQSLICLAVLILYGKNVYKIRWTLTLLYSFIIMNVMSVCFSIGNCIIAEVYKTTKVNDALIRIIQVIIINIAEIAAVVMISIFIDKHLLYRAAYSDYYNLFILVPILFIYFAEQYINNAIFGNTVVLNAGKLVFSFNPLQISITEFSIMALIFFILYLYKKMLDNLNLNIQIDYLKQQEKYLNQYIEEVSDRYVKTRSFRHDIKNHIMIVRDLIFEKDYEQARTYLNDLTQRTENFNYTYHTGNRVLDILLKNKLGIAEERGIKVNCDIKLPYSCGIDDPDICVIFSNALDNALNACVAIIMPQEKYINITSYRQGDLMFLEIENSCFGIKNIKEGVGISNIRTAAAKYGGIVETVIGENNFKLKILLIIPQHNDNIS